MTVARVGLRADVCAQMAEILAHPWLEGSTPGITYVPSPSVSELAQPLPSALHIDRDLFESLCVIWGRHADVDCIQADLLSLAGQGTLAKAFHFLLQKLPKLTHLSLTGITAFRRAELQQFCRPPPPVCVLRSPSNQSNQSIDC